MDRLQAVARIRQRPVHDGGERVGEIALLQRILEIDGLDLAARRRVDRLAHATSKSSTANRFLSSEMRTYQKQTAFVPSRGQCDETRPLLRRPLRRGARRRCWCRKKSVSANPPAMSSCTRPVGAALADQEARQLEQAVLVGLPGRSRRRPGRSSARHRRGPRSLPVAAQLDRSRPKPSSARIASSKRTKRAGARSGSSRWSTRTVSVS